jgi:RNA polymerase sigma factor (sigma-70 family)
MVAGDLVARACEGDSAAIDQILVAIQPTVFNLAVRMLGNREDAQDACQEILLKVVTHLASFRAECAFSTWVYCVSSNHLLKARARAREFPTVSFESLAVNLEAGMRLAAARESTEPLSPEERTEAVRKALSCSQHMLMCLDREHRLAYVLDVVFGLSSDEGAQVLGIRGDAYRKRVSRARARLHGFMERTCGLVGSEAKCRCDAQVRAAHTVSPPDAGPPPRRLEVMSDELSSAPRYLHELMRTSDAVALIRGHPDYRAPKAMIDAVRAVLRRR